MKAILDQWLGGSRHAIHHLEQEVSEHQIAIQHAMSQIRDHTTMIHHLEHHLEIIRRATTDIDSGLGEAELDHEFDAAFGEHYAELESIEPSESELIAEPHDAAVPYGQPGASVSQVVLQLMNREHDDRGRLPPPPPGYARARR